MADTKISAFSSGAPAQAGDVFPIARSGSNYKLAISDIATYITPTIITKTQAEMVALIGSFIPGQLYEITGIAAAQAVVCDAVFIAISTTKISTTGWSSNFTSIATLTAVEVRVDYILATDEITLIYCPSSRNLITANASDTAGLYGVPLDSASIFDNQFHSLGSVNIDPAAIISRSIFSSGTQIVMAAGTTFTGFTEPGASITMADAAAFNNGTLESMAILSMIGTQTGTKWRVGNGKTLDLSLVPSDYTSPDGSYYVGNESTFVCAIVQELLGLTSIPVNAWSDACDYSFCGIFTNLTISSEDANIIDIDTSLTDHKYLFIVSSVAATKSIYFDIGGSFSMSGGVSLRCSSQGDRTEWIPANDTLVGWTQGGNTLIQ